MQKMGYFGFKIQQNLKTMCSQRSNAQAYPSTDMF